MEEEREVCGGGAAGQGQQHLQIIHQPNAECYWLHGRRTDGRTDMDDGHGRQRELGARDGDVRALRGEFPPFVGWGSRFEWTPNLQ